MKFLQEKPIHILCIIGAYLFVAFQPQVSRADCGCNPNYYDVIAYEYTSQSCPPENADDETYYYYIANQVTCNNNIISYYTGFSDGNFTPKAIENTFKSVLIVLRNPSGTHMIAVFPYYNGTILGIDVSSFGPGVYTYPELDEFCNNINIPDNDGDGFPDCLDCDPEDENENAVCYVEPEYIPENNFGPSCPTPSN